MGKDDDRLYLPKGLCARAFGISVQAFSQWDVAPVKKVGREQLYDLRQVIAYKLAKERGGVGPDGELGELNGFQEKARLDKLRADKVEIEIQEKNRTLVPATDVENRLGALIINAKTKVGAVPSKAKARIAHLTLDEVATLEDLCREALEELAACKQ